MFINKWSRSAITCFVALALVFYDGVALLAKDNETFRSSAKNVKFERIEIKSHNKWLFRITNRSSKDIILQTRFGSDDLAFAPPPWEGWQYLDKGKWREINILHEGGYYDYVLKQGKSVQFIADLNGLHSYIPSHSKIRLRNGKYYSDAFSF